MTPRPTVFNVVLERLKDNAAEDTIQMARDVQVLLDSPGWAFVQDFLNQMVAGIDVQMERGIHEQPEYVAMVAERRTLRTPQSVAEGIVEAGKRAEMALNEMTSRLEAGETL